MKFKIPLFPEPFELSLYREAASEEQLAILNEVESRLSEETMREVIQKMHEFYVEGQDHFKEMLPQMIELGAITQQQYDAMRAEAPALDSHDDFITHLQPSFILMVPEPENCGEGTLGLSAECTWDPEHGVGVWFENWKPVRVGFAEAGYP